jgi:hypothetical protein
VSFKPDDTIARIHAYPCGSVRGGDVILSGSLFTLRVRDATHADPEQPTDWLAELVCGKADPKRRAIFECYTLTVLKSVFFGDAPSLASLAAESNDAGVKVLSTRAIKDFKPWRWCVLSGVFPLRESATSGKAGGLTKVERLKAAWPFGRTLQHPDFR